MPAVATKPAVEPIALSLNEVGELLGYCSESIRKRCAARSMPSLQIGNRTLVLTGDLQGEGVAQLLHLWRGKSSVTLATVARSLGVSVGLLLREGVPVFRSRWPGHWRCSIVDLREWLLERRIPARWES